MRLDEYLFQNDISPTEFKEKIGAKSRMTVKRWMIGDRTPNKSMMRKIARITDYQVLPNDFYGLSAATRNHKNKHNTSHLA